MPTATLILHQKSATVLTATLFAAVTFGFGQCADLVPPPAPIWQRIFARPATVRLDTIPAPAGNRLTASKVELGEQLFFDRRLSGNGERSCATCHNPKLGFSDGRVLPIGLNGQPLKRHAPSLWNLAWARRLYWDGRAPTLEAQARVPIEHPNEMGGNLALSVKLFNDDPAMRSAFLRAYPSVGKASAETILAAIASYERSLVSPPSAFDRWIAGDRSALSVAAYRGFLLFTGRAGCLSCHGSWRFSDDRFHDIGLETTDLGRSAVDGSGSLAPRFKTPGLRGLTSSAPYMHDGSKATLDEVLAHYAGGFVRRRSLAPSIVRDLELNAQDRARIIAFLKSLSAD